MGLFKSVQELGDQLAQLVRFEAAQAQAVAAAKEGITTASKSNASSLEENKEAVATGFQATQSASNALSAGAAARQLQEDRAVARKVQATRNRVLSGKAFAR